MYRPSLVRSHWSVVRTLPLIFSPVTLQTSVTQAPLRNLPTTSEWVVAPARTLSEPDTDTVVLTVEAWAALALPPTNAAVADRTSNGLSIHRRIGCGIRGFLQGRGGPFDLPGARLPGRSVPGAARLPGPRPGVSRLPSGRAYHTNSTGNPITGISPLWRHTAKKIELGSTAA